MRKQIRVRSICILVTNCISLSRIWNASTWRVRVGHFLFTRIYQVSAYNSVVLGSTLGLIELKHVNHFKNKNDKFYRLILSKEADDGKMRQLLPLGNSSSPLWLGFTVAKVRSHSCVGVTVIRKLIHTAQSKHYTAFVFDSLHVSLKKIKPSTQPLARPPRPVNNSTK